MQAQEYGIYDLKPFFNSRQFARDNFTVDEAEGIIKLPVA
jgi:hypothetical protein